MRGLGFSLAFTCAGLIGGHVSGQPEAAAHKEAISAEDRNFFESKIRPVLVENCFKCHTGPKLKGKLALDSRSSILKGGDSGPAMVPSHPEKSLLIKAVGYSDPELRMPPRGKLEDQHIADLTEWVKRGAPWPDDGAGKSYVKKDFDLKERAKHLSLQAVTNPPIPKVKNQTWVRSPIDAFILAKLEEQGLMPAAPADPQTLLRRLTFDLTGLPPTPVELDDFVREVEANAKRQATIPLSAIEKAVDRLLTSPAYGERWARHWLDLVRYAETYGHEFDFDIPDAYKYRDYVIRAFNADVPFDQFVLEHIAGDLLKEPRRHPKDKTNESIQATGFWWLGEAKHSPVDSRADQADRIDNQIDVFGKTFLGLTIACARCHDHKFDAISTKDYYALMGFLQSSRQDRGFIDEAAVRNEQMEGAARSPTFVIKHKYIHYRLAGKQARVNLILNGLQLIREPIYGRLTFTVNNDKPHWYTQDVSMWQGQRAYVEVLQEAIGHAELEKVVFSDLGSPQQSADMPGVSVENFAAKNLKQRALTMTDGNAVDEHVFIRGNHKNLGEVVPRRFLEVFGGQPIKAHGSGRLVLARHMVDPEKTPILPRVIVNRLWKHHFGEGIVRSVDDFGVLGQTPTHPELLDFLANELVKNGWSLKKLHRMMVLSSAYQMASRSDRAADEADPDNKLLHKMPVRRLEAEAIRDAILAVSGRLDRTMYGPGVMPHLSAFMVGRGRPSASGPLDGDGRRSIYLAVRRNFLNPMFLAFDYPTPFSTIGRRSVSNVPAQALTMMNNPFVLQQAEVWTKKVLADKGLTAEQRIERMYVAALGRAPQKLEMREALEFVEVQGQLHGRADDPRAWSDLAHVLFNVKEFVFVN